MQQSFNTSQRCFRKGWKQAFASQLLRIQRNNTSVLKQYQGSFPYSEDLKAGIIWSAFEVNVILCMCYR